MVKNIKHLIHKIKINFLILKTLFIKFKYFFKKKCRNNKFFKNKTITDQGNLQKALDWQKRQLAELDIGIKQTAFKYSKNKIKEVYYKALKEIAYQKDIKLYNKEEYMATIKEIRSLGFGDCEDQAYNIMFRLRELGISDDFLGVLFVSEKNKENSGHVFAIVQNQDDDFWILDNGHYLAIPTLASKYLAKRDDIEYVIGYNLYSIWNYENN